MRNSKLGRHKSVDKELKTSISWLKSLEEVKRIVFSRTESARHAYAPGTLRYQMDSPGGMKLKAYGGKGILDIYVKVDDIDKNLFLTKLKSKWQV